MEPCTRATAGAAEARAALARGCGVARREASPRAARALSRLCVARADAQRADDDAGMPDGSLQKAVVNS